METNSVNWYRFFIAILVAVGFTFCLSENALASTIVDVRISDTQAYGEINVPITISNLQGQEIFAYQGEVIYDPNFLSFQKVETTGNFAIAVNPYAPGYVKFAAYGINAITNDGTLMNIKFSSVQEGESEVYFSDFLLNEGNPAVITHAGNVKIQPTQVTVSGSVKYWSNGEPVKGTILSYMDPYATDAIISNSAADGSYSIDLPYNAQGRITAFKSGEDQYITMYDAAYILSCYVYGWGCNPYIADVTGDLQITAFDAREVARFALGYRDDANRLVGQWIFFNPYAQLYGLKEDYILNVTAAQKGNISGNYGGILTTASVAQDFFNIITSTETITIGFSGFPVQSVQFELTGNVNVENVKADGFEIVTNGNFVGLYRDSQVESLEIVVKLSVSETTQIAVSDFRVDDDMLFYEVWQGIVGPGPTPMWVPFVEKEVLNLGEENMPILLPD